MLKCLAQVVLSVQQLIAQLGQLTLLLCDLVVLQQEGKIASLPQGCSVMCHMTGLYCWEGNSIVGRAQSACLSACRGQGALEGCITPVLFCCRSVLQAHAISISFGLRLGSAPAPSKQLQGSGRLHPGTKPYMGYTKLRLQRGNLPVGHCQTMLQGFYSLLQGVLLPLLTLEHITLQYANVGS